MTTVKPSSTSQAPMHVGAPAKSGAALDVDSTMPENGVAQVHDEDTDIVDEDRES